jgi:hypothetical protein
MNIDCDDDADTVLSKTRNVVKAAGFFNGARYAQHKVSGVF